MFQCIAVAKIKDGYLEKVLTAAEKLAAVTRNEEGNLYYNVLRPVDTTDTLIFIEKWGSAANFDAHVQGDACREFGELMLAAENGPSQIFPSNVVL